MGEVEKRDAKSITEDVIARIRRGDLSPGEHLKEKDLADFYGTSRGPVREALKALEARLWLTRDSGRGLRVASPADEQSIDAVWISSVLFGLCARLASMRATSDEQNELFTAVRRVSQAAEKKVDPNEFLAMSHDTLFVLSKSAKSAQLELFFENSVRSALHSFAPTAFQEAHSRRDLAALWLELAVAVKTRDTIRAEEIGRQIPNRALDEILRQQVLDEMPRPKSSLAWMADSHQFNGPGFSGDSTP